MAISSGTSATSMAKQSESLLRDLGKEARDSIMRNMAPIQIAAEEMVALKARIGVSMNTLKDIHRLVAIFKLLKSDTTKSKIL